MNRPHRDGPGHRPRCRRRLSVPATALPPGSFDWCDRMSGADLTALSARPAPACVSVTHDRRVDRRRLPAARINRSSASRDESSFRCSGLSGSRGRSALAIPAGPGPQIAPRNRWVGPRESRPDNFAEFSATWTIPRALWSPDSAGTRAGARILSNYLEWPEIRRLGCG